MPQKLAVIGCGKMAYAILKGLNRQAFAATYCNDINPARTACLRLNSRPPPAPGRMHRCGDMIILAVKPQQLVQVMEDSRDRWTADKLLISVLAGVKTETLEKATGGKTAVIRVMPNTPCLIGQGISALCAGKLTTPVQMLAAQDIFAQLGKVVTVEEKLMDAVTAVSGSGPAYVFSVVEAMINVCSECWPGRSPGQGTGTCHL